MWLKVTLLFYLLYVVYATDFPKGEIFKNRIIGGEIVRKGEFPYYASLYFGDSSNLKYQCGATILNKYWLVTAAHCLMQNKVTYAKVGKIFMRIPEKSEQIVKISRTIIHEDYKGKTSPNDIGLVKLEKSLGFNDYVQPIALPENYSSVDGVVVVCGFGTIDSEEWILPDVLQKAELPIMDLQTCRKKIGSIEEKPIVESNFCTDSLNGFISSCNGDSGGPIVQMNGKTPSILTGIVSWGVWPCAYNGSPAVQTKVSHFVAWIESSVLKD